MLRLHQTLRQTARTSALRQLVRRPRVQQTRGFAAEAEVEYEGFEKTLRTYLPKDEHVVTAILGVYAGLFLLYKATSSSDEAEEIPVAVAVSASGGADDMVPSIFSDKFDDFIAVPGNVERFEKSIEEFDQWIEQPGNAEKYEAQFN